MLPTVVSKQSEALRVTLTFNLFASRQAPERLEILTRLIDRALDASRRHLNSYLVPVGRHKACRVAGPWRCIGMTHAGAIGTGTAEDGDSGGPSSRFPWWGCLVIGTFSVMAKCGYSVTDGSLRLRVRSQSLQRPGGVPVHSGLGDYAFLSKRRCRMIRALDRMT